MPYREIAPVVQFGGAIRCATTVVVRAAASRTRHLGNLRANSPKQRKNSTEVKETDDGDASPVYHRQNNNEDGGNGANVTPKGPKVDHISFASSSTEGPSLTLWLARAEGDIEVRLDAPPDFTLIDCVQRKPRAVVTALLQIGCNRVAAGLSDGAIRVFDAVTLQELQELHAHSSSITCMVSVMMPTAHRPDDTVGFPRASVFVTASSDGTIAKWDGVTLECLGRLKGHGCGVTALGPTIGGVFVFSGAEDGSLRMWSLVDNMQVIGKTPADVKRVVKTKKTAKKDNPTYSQKQEEEPPQQKHRRRRQTSDSGVTSTPVVRTPRAVFQSDTTAEKSKKALQIKPVTPLFGSKKPWPDEPRAGSLPPKRQGSYCGKRKGRKKSVEPSFILEEFVKSFPTGGNLGSGIEWKEGVDGDNSEKKDECMDSGHREDMFCFGADATHSFSETTPFCQEDDIAGGGALGEPRAPHGIYKGKKDNKPTASQFGVVLRQLVGGVVDTPILRTLSATHAWEQENDAGVLLWPLKYEHRQTVTCLAVIWDRFFVSASRDGVAKMFALPSGRMTCTVQRGHVPLTGVVVDEVRCLLWVSSADGSFSVYNILQAGVVRVHSWQDPCTSHPSLVPLVSHETLGQLYVFAKPLGGEKFSGAALNKKNNNSTGATITTTNTHSNNVVDNKRRMTSSHEHHALSGEEGRRKTHQRGNAPRAPTVATLTSIQMGAWGGAAVRAVERHHSLNKELVNFRARMCGAGSRDAVFRRILRRPVSQNSEELLEFLAKEKLSACTALHFLYIQLSLLQVFWQWRKWSARRTARHRCKQKLCILTSSHRDNLLGSYFGCWRRWVLTNEELRAQRVLTQLEARVNYPPPVCCEENKLWSFVGKIQEILGRAACCSLLRRYYKNWLRHTSEACHNRVQSTAFNRLMLSFSDPKLVDATFVWQRLTDTAMVAHRHQRALWMLGQRMALNHRQQLHCYLDKWILFLKKKRETRESLFLVETLSSVLVNEAALRARTFLKWYRFALFETKLRRLEEEETMMKREWIVMQNVADSGASVADLRKEVDELELSLVELAFERDEVGTRNGILRTHIEYLHMQKSLDCLLGVYRDLPEAAHGGNHPLFSMPKPKNSMNINRDRAVLFLDDDVGCNDWMLMRQVGALLQALKAIALQTWRHQNLLSASHKYVAQLPIHDWSFEGGEQSSSMSFSSFDGEVPAFRKASIAQGIDGRLSAERHKILASPTTPSTCLADEFDRRVQRLQLLLLDAAKQTGADLDKTYEHLFSSFVMSHFDKSEQSERKNENITISSNDISDKDAADEIDLTSLHWLNLVPASTRNEVLLLIVDLIIMYDSVKAHSDTEVESGEKKISTRGVSKTMPLPLRSLCKPQTAVCLMRYAAILLELFSPGTWRRYLNLRTLANKVVHANNAVAKAAEDGNVLLRNSLLKIMEPAKRLDDTPSGVHSSTDVVTSMVSTLKLPSSKSCSKLSMEENTNQTRKSRALSWSVTNQRKLSAHKLNQPPSSLLTNLHSPCRQKGAQSGNASATPRTQGSDDCVVGGQNGQCTQSISSSPRPFSGVSTPTKSTHLSNYMRPYLGFRVAVSRDDRGRTILTVQDVTQSYMKDNNSTVAEEGPAYAAGLCTGDQLVRFAGYVVTELTAFNTVVARHVRPSASIPVVLSRNGELISTSIVVGERTRAEGP